MPPMEEGEYLWGEVESTPEFYFCISISELINDLEERIDAIERNRGNDKS